MKLNQFPDLVSDAGGISNLDLAFLVKLADRGVGIGAGLECPRVSCGDHRVGMLEAFDHGGFDFLGQVGHRAVPRFGFLASNDVKIRHLTSFVKNFLKFLCLWFVLCQKPGLFWGGFSFGIRGLWGRCLGGTILENRLQPVFFRRKTGCSLFSGCYES